MTQGNKSYWLTSGIYTILQRFSTLVFNFGSTSLLYRIFSDNQDELGTWGLFLSVVSIIEVARSGLIQNAVVRHLSIAPKEEHGNIISSSLILNILLSLLSIILLIAGSHFLSVFALKAPGLEILLYYYIITTLILLPFFQFQYIQQANLDFKGVFWGMFCRQGLFFIVILIFYIIGYKPTLLNLVHLQTTAALLGALVGYQFTKKFLVITTKINKEWVVKLFNFGKFGFITNLSSIVSGSIDQFMLSNLIGTTAVPQQRAALQVTNAVEVPTNAMADIVFPQSARRMHTDGKEAVKYLYEKSVGVILGIIVPFLTFVVLFPDFIIDIVTGGKVYHQAALILQIAAIYTAIIPFDRQAGVIFDSTGRQKMNFYLQIAAMFINFLTNLFFIKNFGIIGAAYGSLTTYVISFITKQLILRYLYGVEITSIFKQSLNFYADMYKLFCNKILKRQL
ncbi:MAG: oligosaccharide flippase family protein [Cytophagales bacterium]